jgi:hypothetical protein
VAGISFVSLLAYDYRYVFSSIRSYYAIADEIILGLDKDRLSWAGKPFDIDMGMVRRLLAEIDCDNKIRIIEENFHLADTPMQNDTRERQILSCQAQEGNWIVQIDADEILLNPDEFRLWLKRHNPLDFCVHATWLTVFKTFGTKCLVIDPATETTPVATMTRGAYQLARMTAQEGVLSPLRILHFSWGRTPRELRQKLDSWGHRDDFNVDDYLKFWKSITVANHTMARNFHPMHGPAWERLILTDLHHLSRNLP